MAKIERCECGFPERKHRKPKTRTIQRLKGQSRSNRYRLHPAVFHSWYDKDGQRMGSWHWTDEPS